MEKKKNNEFIYTNENAIKVIMNNISDELLEKLSEEDLDIILDLKFEYLESVNIVGDLDKPSFVTYNADVDFDARDEYVISNALKHDIYLSKDELQEIWEGEYDYYEMNGMIGDTPLEEMN
jgi:hypothetical protein